MPLNVNIIGDLLALTDESIYALACVHSPLDLFEIFDSEGKTVLPVIVGGHADTDSGVQAVHNILRGELVAQWNAVEITQVQFPYGQPSTS